MHKVRMWEEPQAPNGRRNPTPTGYRFPCSSAPEVPPTLNAAFQLTVGSELYNQICNIVLRLLNRLKNLDFVVNLCVRKTLSKVKTDSTGQ